MKQLTKDLNLNTANKYSYSESIRSLIINWFTKQDIKYHLTITFSKGTPEFLCLQLLNKFFKHLNRKVYKSRYKQSKNFIEGFVIRERTFAMETYHYHILILNSKGIPSFTKMNNLVLKQASYFRNTKNRRRICYVLLQQYYNCGESKLEHYLTKQFKSKLISYKYLLQNIGWLSHDQIYLGHS